MGFSNNCLLFLSSWERGFSTDNSGTNEPSTLHHEQKISSEEMHTLIIFMHMVSVMASNKQWMAYKLIYNPLIDYIRSHVCLCMVLLYSKASNLCYLLYTPMATGQVVDSQWPYLVVGHLC